jgi:hypothetical protein
MRTAQAKDGTVFISLPEHMQRPITGGCHCPYCRNHPHQLPAWDTLAAHADERHTWVVHYPELGR